MNKLLVIVGPTASGKTKLAARLAKKFNGELVSADSRQVYRGLDIGTGKDRPKGVKIWGYDLVRPKEEFSVGQYQKIAIKFISDIQKCGKLPILVGGTGLYVKSVLEGIPTSNIPKNKRLREVLDSLSVGDLYEKLSVIDSVKAANMNRSDKNNPRRLIRAIEVAQYRNEHKQKQIKHKKYDSMIVGLKVNKDKLEERIKARVKRRIQKGLQNEIRELLKKGVRWEDQSMSSLGYKEWRGCLEHQEGCSHVVDIWARNEISYAKRQMVWFKKQKNIEWFGLNEQKAVEDLVEKWYKKVDV